METKDLQAKWTGWPLQMLAVQLPWPCLLSLSGCEAETAVACSLLMRVCLVTKEEEFRHSGHARCSSSELDRRRLEADEAG